MTRLAERLIEGRVLGPLFVLLVVGVVLSLSGSDPAWVAGLATLLLVPCFAALAVLMWRSPPWTAGIWAGLALQHVLDGAGLLLDGEEPRFTWLLLLPVGVCVVGSFVQLRRDRASRRAGA